MCVFKLYLGRILGTCDQRVDDIAALSGPLLLYHHQPRYQVGSMLLATPDLGPPAPYIPTFYQECAPITPRANQEVSGWLGHHHSAQSVILLADCHFPQFLFSLLSQNSRMQQPLVHLYFLTVLEHLQAEGHKLSSLVRTAKHNQPAVCLPHHRGGGACAPLGGAPGCGAGSPARASRTPGPL